jgi:hypothetical protein
VRHGRSSEEANTHSQEPADPSHIHLPHSLREFSASLACPKCPLYEARRHMIRRTLPGLAVFASVTGLRGMLVGHFWDRYSQQTSE